MGIGAFGGRPAAPTGVSSPVKMLNGSPMGTPEDGEAARRAIVKALKALKAALDASLNQNKDEFFPSPVFIVQPLLATLAW